MKAVYAVVFTPLDTGYMAYVPDLSINTQGDDLAQAIEMARDAIGLMGIDLEDDGKVVPSPSLVDQISCAPGEFVSLVDIDLAAYRRAHDLRTVRKNVTIPSWLNDLAEKNSVNFSAVLQEGLKSLLRVQEQKNSAS